MVPTKKGPLTCCLYTHSIAVSMAPYHLSNNAMNVISNKQVTSEDVRKTKTQVKFFVSTCSTTVNGENSDSTLIGRRLTYVINVIMKSDNLTENWLTWSSLFTVRSSRETHDDFQYRNRLLQLQLSSNYM